MSHPKNTSPKVSLTRRKQRKMLYTSTGDARKKMVSSGFSKDLRKKYGCRRTMLFVGDTVEVMKGEFHKSAGKVVEINYEKMKAYVDSCTRTKCTGGTAQVAIHPSNLRITEVAVVEGRRIQP